MNKRELIEAIETGHAAFKTLLAEFDNEQMACPGVIGAWSVKDTVAHIIVHEQRMIEWITARLHGQAPTLPQPYDMPASELDLLNEQIYQENRSRPLGDVLRDLDRVHEESLSLVEAAADQGLFDASRFHLLGGEPFWEAVAANTFQHYEEHARDIRTWQAARSGAILN